MNKLKAYLIAEKWFNVTGNEQIARMEASLQLVDFNAVSEEYGRMYEESERVGANKWN